MTTNSSATGGYLDQQGTPLTEDQLMDALHDQYAALTGLAADMVRPAYQLTPPKQPSVTTDWLSFWITNDESTDYPVMTHQNGGPSVLTERGMMDVTVTIYGPNAMGLARQLRDSLYVPQNWEALLPFGLKLYEARTVRRFPELFNAQWINRADLEIRMAIAVDRNYNILDIASSQGTITTEDGVSVNWNVNQ